jgi:hypothetical protein
MRRRDAQLEHMLDPLVSRDAVIATGKAEIDNLLVERAFPWVVVGRRELSARWCRLG